MKKYFKTILLILFANICGTSIICSQSPVGIQAMKTGHYTTIDSASVIIFYDMTFVLDSTKQNVINKQSYVLQIGNKSSKFFNAHYYYNSAQRNNPRGESAPNIDGRGLAGTEIYKDTETKSMTVTTILFGSTDVYKYSERGPVINWKIMQERKKISGYDCQKAETSYLGRKYTVWFTHEIPIQNGPWKLGGLPGLILYASDSCGHYIFECTGIQKPSKKEPIVEYDINYKNITRGKLNLLINRMHINFDQYMTSQGKIMAEGSQKNISFPYNPIEIE